MQAFWLLVLAAALGNSNAYWNHCTPTHKCNEGDGDCDSRDDCFGSLFCGTDNCHEFGVLNSYMASGADCCTSTRPPLYHWDFCSTDFPCGEWEGDCDSNDECSGDLVCGPDNCHYHNSSVNPNKDCCVSNGIP